MHVETKYFLIFENILRTRNNFRILQVLLCTIFYKSSGTFNETFLTLSLLAHIFSKKTSWFLFLNKSQVQKSVDGITCFSALSKNENSKASRLIVGTRPPPFQCCPSLSVWCVFFVYLHHFFQHYLCFTGRT